jgi:hypothetical protein
VAVILLFLLLFVSVTLHIFYLIGYIQTRNEKKLKKYISTTITNVLISGSLIFLSLYRPGQIRKINFSLIFWLISGFMMMAMLFVQITIFRRIYQRSQMPENYHLNFFGKKVLHSSVVKPIEVIIFFSTMPFLCVAGAYFVAKLIHSFI